MLKSSGAADDPWLARAATGARAWADIHEPETLGTFVEALRTATGRSTPTEVAASLGWRVTARPLGAERDGLKAILVPLVSGGFSIVVDDALSPSEIRMGAAQGSVFSSRVAHEVAHAFFYDRGAPPWRPDSPIAREEEFCDLFALAFEE